jgi:hypothetical protein
MFWPNLRVNDASVSGNPVVVRKNSVHRFSAQCNIVTSLHPDRPGWSGVCLFFLNVVDFKGVQAGWHFGLGQENFSEHPRAWLGLCVDKTVNAVS